MAGLLGGLGDIVRNWRAGASAPWFLNEQETRGLTPPARQFANAAQPEPTSLFRVPESAITSIFPPWMKIAAYNRSRAWVRGHCLLVSHLRSAAAPPVLFAASAKPTPPRRFNRKQKSRRSVLPSGGTPHMAPPPKTPPPSALQIATFRFFAPDPQDEKRSPPRRPEHDVPKDVDMQRWLDLSG